ncbi:LCP family protein [Jeotgalibacillus proteolyticus]|uniref:Transcriptional regulator n=1 Tax=Jeotgalibacillus proteolyticus TaxID=2082395 RepID=A0A2S5GBH2_9BACL|nr:LCP family protein [Jeotgalibacillus proteolyticus]PPA70265.1 transcriptional regulator [Jeotgalibacillus proteolyticus]
MDRKSHKKKTNKRKRRTRILWVLFPILLLGLSAIGYGGYLYVKAQAVANNSYEELDRKQSEKREEIVDPDVDHVSILFLGIDESEKRSSSPGFEGNIARTDAMILATLNNDDKTVKLTSIPRDTLAYIPEVDYSDKINHAHAFGGPKASMEAVEELLDVPVDYYVRMNFYAFMDVVEALNGIQVDVPFDMEEMNSDDSTDAISLREGRQTLDGEEALAFVRSRSYDSDLARGERQLEIMQAILDRAASVGSINKYADVIEAVGNNMQTNMRFNEMRSFISYAANSNLSVEMETIIGDNATYNGVYYYEPEPESLSELQLKLREHLGLPASPSDEMVDPESDPSYEDPSGTEEYPETDLHEREEDLYQEDGLENDW